MITNLTVFVFLGILVALAYHLGMALVYQHFFSTSVFFQRYWYLPLVGAPALLLAGLARLSGLLRKDQTFLANAACLAIIAVLVALTVGAPYSCWMGCF